MTIQRNTVQRQIVLDAMKKLNKHPSVEEVFDEVNKTHAAISKTTVYRNLRQLAESGIIRKVMLPDGLERYDGNSRRHYHFNCKSCGQIFDLDVEYLLEINDDVQSKYGFQVDDHDIVFSGICQNCKQK